MRTKYKLLIVAFAAFATMFCFAAQALAGPPKILPRSAWDPQGECQPRGPHEEGKVCFAVVHHSYIPDSNYTLEEVPARIRGMFRFHRDDAPAGRAWNDIGYNFIVDKWGNAYEGRAGGADKAVVGAHSLGFNSLSTGILVIGDYTKEPPSKEALEMVAKIIAWKLPLHGADVDGVVDVVSPRDQKTYTVKRIVGHRDLQDTECPGQAYYDLLPQLREMVKREVAVREAEEAAAETKVRSGNSAPAAVTKNNNKSNN